MRAVRVEQLLRIDGAAPRRVDAHDLGAAPPRDLAHALAEHPVDTDDRGVARLEQVDEARFHAGGTGTADRQRQRVVGAKEQSQPVGDLVEHDEEVGIEVPEDGALERFHDLGIRIRRTRPEQQPISVKHAGRLPPAPNQQQCPGEETQEPDRENAAHLAAGERQRAGVRRGRRLRPDDR